jgi:hypothetical protein
VRSSGSWHFRCRDTKEVAPREAKSRSAEAGHECGYVAEPPNFQEREYDGGASPTTSECGTKRQCILAHDELFETF